MEESFFTGDSYAGRVLDWIVFPDGGRAVDGVPVEYHIMARDRMRKSSITKLQQQVQHGQCE